MSWRRQVAVVAIVAILVGPTIVPEMLLFPYSAQSGDLSVRSERPIDQAALDKVAARSRSLVAASPLAASSEPRRLFLTDGGWRWTWLALQNRGAFGISRPGRETIVVNRSDIAADSVRNGATIGGRRSLSGTIAHEICHGMIRRQFGFTADWSKPVWLREGYCDHVAQESSLSAQDVARLQSSGSAHPALPYYEGRLRVARALKANGNDVNDLFATN